VRVGPGRLAQLQASTSPTRNVVDVPPSTESIRAAIQGGTCPFCRQGPFKYVATHTNKIHGVDRYALRDLAGYTYSESLLSPELHEEVSHRAQERVRQGLSPVAGFTTEQRRVFTAKKYRMSLEGSARRREIGKQTVAVIHDRYLAEVRERDLRICELIDSGIPQAEIGKRLGISQSAVWRAKRRAEANATKS